MGSIIKTILPIWMIMLFGCASHTSYNLKELDSSATIQSHQYGVTVFLRPFLEKDELLDFFGKDLVNNGILPMQVRISNESDSDIGIDKESFLLADPNGTFYRIASAENAFQKSKDGYWSTPIWTLAFGTLGLFGSIGNVTDSNIKLDSDLQTKLFKCGTIQRHRDSGGIVFFQIQQNTRNLKNWEFHSRVFSRKDKGTFDMKVPL